MERAARCPEDPPASPAIAGDAPRASVLRFDWYLGVGCLVDVGRVRHQAPALLAALEESGLEAGRYPYPVATSEVPSLAALRAVGVRSLYHLGEADGNGGTLDIAIRLPASRRSTSTLALDHRSATAHHHR